MGSDRDYRGRYNERSKDGRKSSDKRSKSRINAMIALDKAGKMTKEDAIRIQSSADRTGRNQDFKSRAMSAAERNEDEESKD